MLSSIPNYDLVYLPEATESDILSHLDATALFTNPNKTHVYLGPLLLNSLSQLKVIATASTGTNHIDTNFCDTTGVTVLSLTNERQVINSISSTAELALSLSLASLRNIFPASLSVREGTWNYEQFVGTQIKDISVGIVGYGRLGSYYANYIDALGANVYVYDPYTYTAHPRFTQLSLLTELASICDLISLHVHDTDETRGLIDEVFFNSAKSTLILVNTSRGEIVNELSLLHFLQKNPFAKYATDVLSSEYNGITNNLLWKYSTTNPNQVLITPHIGGMTHQAQLAAYSHAANLLKTFILSQ